MEEALRSGPFINNSLIAVIKIAGDGIFSPMMILTPAVGQKLK